MWIGFPTAKLSSSPSGSATGHGVTGRDQPPVRNWREDAACRDADPEMFFPIG